MADQVTDPEAADGPSKGFLASLGLAAGSVVAGDVAAKTASGTTASIVSAFLKTSGVVLGAANRLAARNALGAFPDGDARRIAAELADWSGRYRRTARKRLGQEVVQAIRLPSKKMAIQALERDLKEAQAKAPGSVPRIKARLKKVRVEPGQRERAVQRAVRREASHAAAHARANQARAVGTANASHLEAIGRRAGAAGAVWHVDPSLNNEKFCLRLDGKLVPWSLLREAHPPLHARCGCWLSLPRDGETPVTVSKADWAYASGHDHAMALAEAFNPGQARDHGGRWTKTGGGDCYPAAFNEIFKHGDDWRLVQATVRPRLGKLRNQSFGHAWVENGSTVIDRSNGADVEMPRDVYYLLGRVEDAHRFTKDEALKLGEKTGHAGPW